MTKDSITELLESVDQNSDMWGELRRGKFTASTMSKLISEPKSKEAKDAGRLGEAGETLVATKVAEILTGEVTESPNTLAIVWGHTHEPKARELFSLRSKIEVELAGFCEYGKEAGGSPDGIFKDADGKRDGIIEIKCPYNPANHIEHLLIDSQEYFKANFKEYYWQMQANMLFTGTDKGFFISYDPRMGEDEQLFTILIKADSDDHKLIDKKIEAAVKYKNEILNKINSKKQAA